ncbi:MAG: response regulator [Deltaproteobacteria bacterium]|nr:response regulator [Deltaproteobacteria bacterium]
MVGFIKRKLALKLIMIITLVVTMVSLLAVLYFNRINSRLFYGFLQNSVTNTIKFVTIGYTTSLWNVDIETLDKLNMAVLNNPMLVAVNIFDHDFGFLRGHKRGNIDTDTQQLQQPYTADAANPHLKSITGKINSKSGLCVGNFEIFYTERTITELLRQSNIRLLAAFMAITLLNIGIIFLGLRKYSISPIVTLSQATQEIARTGNYAMRAKKPSEDEIGVLYDCFNDMLDQIHSRSMERDRFESELQRAKNLLSNVINSMPSMLISVDGDGIITDWNEAAAQHMGILATDAIGKNIWKTASRLSILQDGCREVTATKTPRILQRQKFENLKNKVFNVSLYPLVSNGVTGMVMRIDDVTELEIKDNELQQAQKMEIVGTLAGGLAHDFNNVLGGITGTLSLLKHKIKKQKQLTSETLEPFIETMQGAGVRAADMVQQLLTLSRKRDVALVPLDLNITMKHVMKLCQNSFDKCIELNFVFGNNPYITNADPIQIEQVLLNLCVNASHAMTIMRDEDETQGGTLTVEVDNAEADHHFCSTHPEAAPDTRYWKLCVQDTGIGMDTKTASKIFDPFFTTKEKGKGTGLGLAMVYNIIKQHKSFIDLYSEKGLGSTFSVYLPMIQQDSCPEDEADEEQLPRGAGLVLVVDDEKVMRDLARAILEECGYEVVTAEDGAQGVEVFRRRHREFKAVLLDMIMPKKTGKDAYIEMKKINPDLKVLLASGFKLDEKAKTILKLGVQGFLQKPYTLERLAKALDKILKN